MNEARITSSSSNRSWPAVQEPADHIYMDQGGDPIGTREDLEAAYIKEYERGAWAFENASPKRFIEYRESLTPVSPSSE